MQALIVALFATALGFAVSGAIANLYWLVARTGETVLSPAIYWPVMVLAGPNVMLQSATKSYRERTAPLRIWLPAVMVCLYWAFVVGLLTLYVWAAI